MTHTTRQHHMPFGAEVLGDGRVRFRLWAPAAEQVEVCLQPGPGEGETPCFQMVSESGGWFGISSGVAGIGTGYRFRINGGTEVPDPASRYQPQDVHGPSEVIYPGAWHWRDTQWRGRPWEEAVLYELHVGCFSESGDFAGVRARLDELVELGVTAIELMPVADFPGARNWGYDGTFLFAPDSRYGRPEDLKALVDAAHARGLMVFLDVVYNHFGPEGNYLPVYAPAFFSERHVTPWGAAINFDGAQSHWVRQFYIHNALYWLEEYHLDGLRLDAVHAIVDDSQPDFLGELAQTVRSHFGDQRHVHLILENDHNAAHYLQRDAAAQPELYTAQWNDDLHHALHVLLTNEARGYYQDYADAPVRHLGRCLAEGFAWQGERSSWRHDRPRGEPSGHLPPTAFVGFLQNHDQVGNRAFGERIHVLCSDEAVRAALAVLLLSPAPPLLFMGQEWGCRQPFVYFCDFEPKLTGKVAEGRRREFADFPPFRDPPARPRIPDPGAEQTFRSAVLDWPTGDSRKQQGWLELHCSLLAIRQHEVVPRLSETPAGHGQFTLLGKGALSARWQLAGDTELILLANMDDDALQDIDHPVCPLLYTTHPDATTSHELPPWSVFWHLRSMDSQT
ncbi:MAG: malto-oligosyltrehalose trehalohydrolase [Pseudomonadota bacterium]